MTNSTTTPLISTPSGLVANLPNLAIVGKAGSGKTTAATFLACNYGYHVHHFAYSLKQACRALWGDDVMLDREKMQWFGNTMREYDDKVFVNACARNIDRDLAAQNPVVVDDCRFSNEVDVLAERGFHFIKIEADEDVRVLRLQANGKFGTREQLSDATETGLDHQYFENVIQNDGDEVGWLYTQIVNKLNKIRREV